MDILSHLKKIGSGRFKNGESRTFLKKIGSSTLGHPIGHNDINKVIKHHLDLQSGTWGKFLCIFFKKKSFFGQKNDHFVKKYVHFFQFFHHSTSYLQSDFCVLTLILPNIGNLIPFKVFLVKNWMIQVKKP